MDNQTLQRVRDLLATEGQIGIVVGKNPTIDEMGAGLALYLSLLTAGKKVTIASATEPIVEISNLVGIDEVKTSLGGDSGDLVVSFPYKEGEIEKVSYTLDDKYLNIVVKAGTVGLSFEEKDVRFQRAGSLPTVVFMVGVPRLTDLGNLFDPNALKDTTMVNIDNKSDNQGYGDVVLVSPRFSSVSEQVAQLLTSLNLEIDIDIAQNLLSGILYATDNFQKPETSYIAFELAGRLMEKGARRIPTPARSMAPQTNADDFSSFFGAAPQSFDKAQDRSFDQIQDRSDKTADRPFDQFGPSQTNQPRQKPFDQAQGRSFDQGQDQNRGQNQQKRHDQRQFDNNRQNQPRQQNQNQQQHAPKTQTDPQGTNEKKEEGKQQPPPDWLMPKVYKGSSNV
jgi:hypothetical protein